MFESILTYLVTGSRGGVLESVLAGSTPPRSTPSLVGAQVSLGEFLSLPHTRVKGYGDPVQGVTLSSSLESVTGPRFHKWSLRSGTRIY